MEKTINKPQETQGKTTNTINNNDNTQIDNTTLLSHKTGVNVWRINPQITKPTSTSTGVLDAEILES
jgi:hypothetical protein